MLFQKNLLWSDADDADGVTKEVLVATRPAVAAIRYEVQESKKKYVDLLQSLPIEVQWKRSECEGKKQRLEAQAFIVEESALKGGLLVHEPEKMGEM